MDCFNYGWKSGKVLTKSSFWIFVIEFRAGQRVHTIMQHDEISFDCSFLSSSSPLIKPIGPPPYITLLVNHAIK